jgi:hypothetical protein
VKSPHRIARDEKQLYRSWNDIQGDLITLLETFFKHTQTDQISFWDTEELVQGILAIRLLAAVKINFVSDSLVDLLTRFDKTLRSEEFGEEETRDLRKLIEVAWERCLLERVGTSNGTAYSRLNF